MSGRPTLAGFRDLAVGTGALGALAFFIADALNYPGLTRRTAGTKPGPVDVDGEHGWLHKASDGTAVRPATLEESNASAAARLARGGDGFFAYAVAVGDGPYSHKREIVLEDNPRYGPATTSLGGEAYFVDRFSHPNGWERSDDEVSAAEHSITVPAVAEPGPDEPPAGVRLVDSMLDSAPAEPWDVDEPEPASTGQ